MCFVSKEKLANDVNQVSFMGFDVINRMVIGIVGISGSLNSTTNLLRSTPVGVLRFLQEKTIPACFLT